MNRSSLLAPPVGWICHACGWSSETKPERCPKCGGSAFERTGQAEAVRDAERESEGLVSAATRTPRVDAGGLAAVHRKETAMAQFDCVGGCGALASKKGGRCRTCAGLLRRKKRAGRPVPATPPLSRSGAQIARHRREAPVPTSAAPDDPKATKSPSGVPLPEQAAVGATTAQDLAEALRGAGFNVADVRVVEVALLVRLTA